jgi:hypothetical protein
MPQPGRLEDLHPNCGRVIICSLGGLTLVRYLVYIIVVQVTCNFFSLEL